MIAKLHFAIVRPLSSNQKCIDQLKKRGDEWEAQYRWENGDSILVRAESPKAIVDYIDPRYPDRMRGRMYSGVLILNEVVRTEELNDIIKLVTLRRKADA